MDERLIRGIDLPGAIALNIISMIGIGPLITIPLVLGALHGPLSLAGWLLGALLAGCDGLIWAELGSLYPRSGGTYGYLLAVFGSTRTGRLLAFLFVWQTIFVAPLNQATGYIGFANYAGYLFPRIATSPWAIKGTAIGVGIVTLFALYRNILTISRVGILLAITSIVTLLCVSIAAFAHFSPQQAFMLPAHDSIWSGLRAGIGQALIIAMYDYLGYNQSSCVGGEVRDPARVIPRSILLAIALVALLYISLQIGVLGAVPWQTVVPLANGDLPPLGQHLASAIAEHAFGGTVAVAVTTLILVTAFASTYGNLLGYSRVPFAAASDGLFLAAFARVHTQHRFPHISLLVMGLLALPACLFPLDQVINALSCGIVLVQSIAQIAALSTLRSRGIQAPYRMRFYPIPALIALAGWAFVFLSAGWAAMTFGLVSLLAGAVVFFKSRASR
jgi:amino acid transporter